LSNIHQPHPKPLSILYLIYGFRVGGAERLLLDLLKGLDPKKFKTEIIYFHRDEQMLPDFLSAGIRCTFFAFSATKLNLREIWRLSRLIRKRAPDIVHVHLFHASRYGTLAAWLAGVRRIIRTKHSVPLPESKPAKRDILWNAFLSFALTRVIAVSQAVARQVKTSHVIYNGVDTDYFNRENIDWTKLGDYIQEFGAKGYPVVGIVARFSKYKGYPVLLEGFSKLLSDWSDGRLLIAGDGEERVHIEALADKLKISDRVIFLGSIRNVREFLAVLDLYVQPSIAEGLGISVIEALSMELPVVATRVSGISEIITDGEDGLLTEPNDPEALSRSMDRILRDTILREHVKKNARKTAVEQFGLNTMVRKYESLYMELCDRKPSGRQA
jgi:glycosyltransferase involved in cell wall biosynthesis